jgi:hypothetical protein
MEKTGDGIGDRMSMRAKLESVRETKNKKRTRVVWLELGTLWNVELDPHTTRMRIDVINTVLLRTPYRK